jgi:hypothetical protein
MHFCKNVKENYNSLMGQENPSRGPYVAYAWSKETVVSL